MMKPERSQEPLKIRVFLDAILEKPPEKLPRALRLAPTAVDW